MKSYSQVVADPSPMWRCALVISSFIFIYFCIVDFSTANVEELKFQNEELAV